MRRVIKTYQRGSVMEDNTSARLRGSKASQRISTKIRIRVYTNCYRMNLILVSVDPL
jgi:hypothetical protein